MIFITIVIVNLLSWLRNVTFTFNSPDTAKKETEIYDNNLYAEIYIKSANISVIPEFYIKRIHS